MPVQVTIDAFSGRPNPTLVLEGLEADELLERVTPAKRVSRKDVAAPPESILGYRGVIIEQVGERRDNLPERFRVAGGVVIGPKLHHRPADPFVEDFVCGSTGPIRLPPLDDSTIERIREQVRELREIDWAKWEIVTKSPKRATCPCAPLYEPNWWNDGGQKQYNNNCYNYGTDYRTDTFAQPGRASGQMYGHPIGCGGVGGVHPAAIRDDLIDNPNANNKCPAEGHLVALVVAPGYDFHWYRKGRNGRWSHKPGSTPVVNVDNSGNPITDPRNANRGPYTDFCTFMTVMHGHIKIQ